MKKTVVELFFLNECNSCVASEIPRHVYRHCSTLPPFKMKRLAAKLKIGLTRLLVGVFTRLIADHFNREHIAVVSRLNKHTLSMWHCSGVKDPLEKMLKEMTFTKEPNDKFPDIDALALKFEVKIIKYKVLFAFYYPEDYFSETLNAKILVEYEKILREMLKLHGI